MKFDQALADYGLRPLPVVSLPDKKQFLSVAALIDERQWLDAHRPRPNESAYIHQFYRTRQEVLEWLLTGKMALGDGGAPINFADYLMWAHHADEYRRLQYNIQFELTDQMPTTKRLRGSRMDTLRLSLCATTPSWVPTLTDVFDVWRLTCGGG